MQSSQQSSQSTTEERILSEPTTEEYITLIAKMQSQISQIKNCLGLQEAQWQSDVSKKWLIILKEQLRQVLLDEFVVNKLKNKLVNSLKKQNQSEAENLKYQEILKQFRKEIQDLQQKVKLLETSLQEISEQKEALSKSNAELIDKNITLNREIFSIQDDLEQSEQKQQKQQDQRQKQAQQLANSGQPSMASTQEQDKRFTEISDKFEKLEKRTKQLEKLEKRTMLLEEQNAQQQLEIIELKKRVTWLERSYTARGMQLIRRDIVRRIEEMILQMFEKYKKSELNYKTLKEYSEQNRTQLEIHWQQLTEQFSLQNCKNLEDVLQFVLRSKQDGNSQAHLLERSKISNLNQHDWIIIFCHPSDQEQAQQLYFDFEKSSNKIPRNTEIIGMNFVKEIFDLHERLEHSLSASGKK